jgi:uncharacterized Ntn-hydrolase superfamily protein
VTYSIVARDPETGELGVAVQSHWFSVGSVVSWAAPGVGAVATQANAEIAYGPRMLDALAAGAAPEEALAELTSRDAAAAHRQVAAVDAAGRLGVHTGAQCIAFAGHATGGEVSCQANMMRTPEVWPAMLSAFGSATGPLAGRLLAALQAGEAAGGDARGRQSAALLVVPAEGERWQTLVSLRVEDHPNPLAELERLLMLHEAYRLAGQADGLVAEGRHREAGALYQRAGELVGDNPELRFWAGLAAAQAGEMEDALRDVRAAIAAEPGWRGLLERLSPEVAPSAAAVRAALESS